MTFFALTLWEGIAVGLCGVGTGYVLDRWWISLRHRRLKTESDRILAEADREAEALRRESRVASTEEALKIREQAEKAATARKLELTDQEQRVVQRESLVNRQLESVLQQEQSLQQQRSELKARIEGLDAEREAVRLLICQRHDELQKVAQLTAAEARQTVLRQAEQDALRDANDLSRHLIGEARAQAETEARRIVATAIQRYAGEQTFENTTATVALHGDDIKGRIIGREGRNIRAFEAATGTTVLIDDTPNAVVLSGFDPVRREIAREAMHRLIQDGRIHPTRIEEVVAKVTEEMDETIVRAGQDAVQKLGIPPLHPEIVRLLGRLRYRHSFSQNILDHSVEVGRITSLLAAELGLDLLTAKRAGLLHDIGKALNHEVEGSHALIGADFIKRFGESDEVVNGVASHHHEVPHTCLWGILVSAADAISASRPGARSETMTTYIRRLEDLEKIGLSFPGVEKCFAVQAGRELRIVVQPELVSDEQSYALARGIARKIEEELQYPGQIRVTVVRETRCVDFAK